MTRKKILGSHVKRLLSGVAEHGKKHLMEVETDLVQTGILLDEAIEKLTQDFMAIHGCVAAQQGIIDLLLAGGMPTPQQRTELGALQQDIAGHVGGVVTSLQFQDMTSQLIVRTLKRVAGLREFLDTLAFHGAQALPESDSEEIVELLARVRTALAIQSLELGSVLRRAVSQRHLESGEIVLF